MLDSLRGILRRNGHHHHNTSLSIDDIYQLLSNERRRAVIRLLSCQKGAMDVGELAEMMTGEPGNTAQNREFVALHHQHLPQLNEAGVVRYDQRSKVVKAGHNLGVVYRIHCRVIKMLPETTN